MSQPGIKTNAAASIFIWTQTKKNVMEEIVTKQDLRQFGLLLLDNIQIMFQEINTVQTELLQPEWLKSKGVRKMLDISPGSVQNLRVRGKVRFKKILGTYYYNTEDLKKLFDDEQQDK